MTETQKILAQNTCVMAAGSGLPSETDIVIRRPPLAFHREHADIFPGALFAA